MKFVIGSDIYELLDLAEYYGIIHYTKRDFAEMKTLTFVSLKLESISRESLLWVISTLKRDEMTPSERVIQSRIKEAFGLKMAPEVWESIISMMEEETSTFQVIEIEEDLAIRSKTKAIYLAEELPWVSHDTSGEDIDPILFDKLI